MRYINTTTLEEVDSDANIDVCITPGYVRRDVFMRTARWDEFKHAIDHMRQCQDRAWLATLAMNEREIEFTATYANAWVPRAEKLLEENTNTP